MSNFDILRESEGWPAFVLPWNDTGDSPTDISGLLEKSAGATGFIQRKNGHLATGDGKRWRFWGVGQVFAAYFPPMEQAGVIARRMAKFGINCLRLHHLDHRWPNGILKRYDEGKDGPGIVPGASYPHPGVESTRELDPEAMARLDWFVYCCKANGIYVDFNLNVTRRFSVSDGVRDSEEIGYSKGITYYDDRIVFLEKEYAMMLLDHYNPFTKTRYADEPAVAMIEVLNENSLAEAWVRGALAPEVARNADMTWRIIPPSYADDLTRRWNLFLAKKYANRDELKTAWEGDLQDFEDPTLGSVRRLNPAQFAAASRTRFIDESSFYNAIETEFFTDMAAFLRSEVGVKQLIVPTSDHNHNWSAIPMLEADANLDIIDGHAYWYVPWQKMFTAQHIAQVDNPDTSMPALLSRTIVKDYPYIVSEINESFPNDFACEAIPLVTAYALLQDWDGIFWHSYTGGHFDWDNIWQQQSYTHHLRISTDPIKMSQMAISGLMFLRGDVKSAEQLIERHIPTEWGLESARVKMDKSHVYWLPYLPNRVSLVHRVAIADFHADELRPKEGEVEIPSGEIRSDTGELVWEDNPNDGRVLINAPRHQGVIMRAGERSTDNITVKLENKFAAVQLASLDDLPIAESGKLLLVAAARVANTGMVWEDETRTSIRGSRGEAPTRIEPVRAALELKGLKAAKQVTWQPLDGNGLPCDQPRTAVEKNGSFFMEINENPGTTWYLVEVAR